MHGFASVNGARLHYELQGGGFPVVLLQGGPQDLHFWDAQVGPLARHFTVLRHDPRGCGLSEAPHGQPFAAHADVRALLDQLFMDRVHLVGHSLGGRVALDFAMAFPERVSCLVLVAPGDLLLRGPGLRQLQSPLRVILDDKGSLEDYTPDLLDFLQEEVPLHRGDAPPP